MTSTLHKHGTKTGPLTSGYLRRGAPLARVNPAIALVFCAVCVLVCPLAAQAADKGDERLVVVKAGKAITVSGEEIKNAIIVIKDGKIDAVGSNVDYPSDSRVIDASDLVVMPGMINPHTRLGLPGLRRSGNKSHLKLGDHFYPPEDDTYAKLLEAGYTAVGLYAQGTGLPGQSLVIHTAHPKVRKGFKATGLVRMTFDRPSRDKKGLRSALKAAQDHIDKDKKKADADKAAKPAKGKGKPPATSRPSSRPAKKPTSQPTSGPTSKPAAAKKKPAIKPELAPLVSLLQKKDGFAALVEFSRASDVLHFAELADKYDFARSYLFAGGASDLHHVFEHALFGKKNALVGVTGAFVNMPLTVNPVNRAREFAKAGCRVAILPASDSITEHERIRERLAALVRAGLSRSDALKGVTLHPAAMLLLDKQLGSIEKGKNADLIFLDGDPLDPFARVVKVMVDGEIVADYTDAER